MSSPRRTGPTSGAATSPYPKSKTVAERAAWDFVEREGQGMELAVVNPVGVFGPVLGPDYSTSILLAKRLLDGALPGCPQIWLGVVDVRDVADLHLRAMTHPAAAGQRFLATAGDFLSVVQIARILKSQGGAMAAKVPTRPLPNWQVRLVALVDPAARTLLPELGKRKNGSGDKAQALLGWSPRTPAEAILATAESLERLGLLGRR